MSFSAITHIWERAVFGLLAALTLLVLVEQARVLYIFPQPDSARWWGDETGQMLELRAEVQDGYARIPTGLGSSVAITNGLVRGNSWLAAAVYGVPAILFSRNADLVTIGRSVTFVLSLLLLGAMFWVLRAMWVPRLFAVFAILLFVSTRSFFFSSHAARLDIAAGLAIMVYAGFLAVRYERFRSGVWEPSVRWYFGYGIVAIVLATLSIHLLTLIGALSLYLLWRFRAERNIVSFVAAAGGVVAALAMLISIYALSGAPVSLFGPSSVPNQFQSVAAGLPVLRPLSRSVQVGNIMERLNGMSHEAPAFLALLGAACIVWIVRRRTLAVNARQQWFFGATLVVAVAWLLFESPALYYYVQVLPLFIVVLIAIIAVRIRESFVLSVAILIAGLCLAYFALNDVACAARTSTILARDNTAALESAVRAIEADWHSPSAPLVLAQNPAIAYLEHDPHVRLMTPHLVSFPTSHMPVREVLASLGVNYILLYGAPHGHIYSVDERVLRPIADSVGTLLMQKTGTLFDVDRDYFRPIGDTTANDTLFLYKLSPSAR